MQISVENVGKLGKKLTVRIPAERLDSTVQSRIQELGRTTRLKGFRPGKIPTKVIEQRFGAQVRGEALSDLIGKTFQEAVTQQQLQPAVSPSISVSGQPAQGEIEYTATFEVMPEIGKIDVSALQINKPVATVTEADIDQMIETLRMQRRTWSLVERATQPGDMVLFEYSAQGSDFRHPTAGNDRIGTVLGSGALSKELEDQLVGYKAGDDIEIDLAFPEGFRVAELAGKLARLSARIVRVQAAHTPAVDEAFISAFGVTEGGLAKFREDVRDNLQRELRGMLIARLKAATAEKLVDAHLDLELPQGMIEDEARALARQAGGEGKVEPPIEPLLPVARRRVTAGVLMTEIARQNNIRLDSNRVSETLAAIASTYEDPAQVIELYSKNAQVMNGLKSRVLEDQVVEWIADHAKITEQPLTFSEVMRPS